MKKLWEWIKTNVGKAATVVWHALTTAGKAIARAFTAAVGWMKAHLAVTITVAAVVVLSLGLGLGLGLTLPVKSVEVEGEVFLLRGEGYKSGFTIKQTTRAGLVHREPVVPSMLSEFDISEGGDKDVVVTYKGWKVPVKVKVLAESDITLRLRDGSLPTEYEPGEEFSTYGIFDLYYNNERIRSAPVTKKSASGFTSRLSGNYTITLTYRPGLSVEYSYKVLEVISNIEPTGFVYIRQGSVAGKQTLVGNLRLRIFYKDGREEVVSLYDDGVLVQDDIVEERDAEYTGSVILNYKGFDVACDVTAYQGELLAPKSVELLLDRSVYAVGESFDYVSTYLKVVYERFGGIPVELRAFENNILLMEREGDFEGAKLVPLTDGINAIVFDEERSYEIVATYFGVQSEPLRLRVISAEDVGKVTSLFTPWTGGTGGPPKLGEELNFEQAKLEVEYGYGYSTETVDILPEMVTGYDKEKPGDQVLTVSYGDEQYNIGIRVVDADSDEITSILWLTGWDAPTYYSSDELVVPENAYLEVEIGYGGHENERIYLKDNPDITITGFVPHTIEEQTLTITYKGFDFLQRFTVNDDRTEDIIDFWAPYAIRIDVNTKLDLSGKCTVFYSTGRQDHPTLAEVLEAGGAMLGDYDLNTVGDYPVMIYYPGYKDTDHPTWIYVEGEVQITANGIELDLSEAEQQTPYGVGDAINLNGMKLWLVYSNNEREDITSELDASMFLTFSTATPGTDLTTTVVYFYSETKSFATVYKYSVE